MTNSCDFISTDKIFLTDLAVSRVMNVTDNGKDGALRLRVSSAGCHGFMYDFSIEYPVENDVVVVVNGINVLAVDKKSLPLLEGSTIDFVKSMFGGKLVVKSNPNATGGCGCGSSFSI